MKSDLRANFKALRLQMNTLENKCKEREDKLVRLLLILEPFINAMPPEVQKEILGTMALEDI